MQKIFVFAAILGYCFGAGVLSTDKLTFKIQYKHVKEKDGYADLKSFQLNITPSGHAFTIMQLKQAIYKQMEALTHIPNDYYILPQNQILDDGHGVIFMDMQYLNVAGPLPTTLYLDNSCTHFHVTGPDGVKHEYSIAATQRGTYKVSDVKMDIQKRFVIDLGSTKLFWNDKLLNDDTKNFAEVTNYAPTVYLIIKKDQLPAGVPDDSRSQSRQEHTSRNTRGNTRATTNRRDSRSRGDADVDSDTKLDKDSKKGELLGIEYKYWMIGGIGLIIFILIAVLICVAFAC